MRNGLDKVQFPAVYNAFGVQARPRDLGQRVDSDGITSPQLAAAPSARALVFPLRIRWSA
jgi:hypothetical protein